MTGFWVELDISPYNEYKVIAYRLDDGITGTLKGEALRKAQQVINMYTFNGINYSGIYGEIFVNEHNFVPVDANPLEIEFTD
jgi:hypothetical protein